jgi:hypothetical protein
MFMLDYYNLMLLSFRLLGIFSVLLKVGEQLRPLGMMPIAARPVETVQRTSHQADENELANPFNITSTQSVLAMAPSVVPDGTLAV